MKHTNHIIEWLTDPRMDEFLGRRACFKLAVLSAVISGNESLASVARHYGVTPQAAQKHAANARRIFGK